MLRTHGTRKERTAALFLFALDLDALMAKHTATRLRIERDRILAPASGTDNLVRHPAAVALDMRIGHALMAKDDAVGIRLERRGIMFSTVGAYNLVLLRPLAPFAMALDRRLALARTRGITFFHASTAIDTAAGIRLERNLKGIAAFRAHGIIHHAVFALRTRTALKIVLFPPEVSAIAAVLRAEPTMPAARRIPFIPHISSMLHFLL